MSSGLEWAPRFWIFVLDQESFKSRTANASEKVCKQVSKQLSSENSKALVCIDKVGKSLITDTELWLYGHLSVNPVYGNIK